MKKKSERIPKDVDQRNAWATRIVEERDAAEARAKELEAMVADRGRERDAAQEAAGSAERRLGELEAQCAAMREALERSIRALEGHGYKDLVGMLHPALSSDAGRALLERVEALERDLAEKSARCSRGAHAIIDLIGAHGPEHIDETCARAAKRIEAQDRRIAALERVSNAAGALMDVLAEFGTLDGMSQSVDAVTDALDAMEAKR